MSDYSQRLVHDVQPSARVSLKQDWRGGGDTDKNSANQYAKEIVKKGQTEREEVRLIV